MCVCIWCAYVDMYCNYMCVCVYNLYAYNSVFCLIIIIVIIVHLQDIGIPLLLHYLPHPLLHSLPHSLHLHLHSFFLHSAGKVKVLSARSSGLHGFQVICLFVYKYILDTGFALVNCRTVKEKWVSHHCIE